MVVICVDLDHSKRIIAVRIHSSPPPLPVWVRYPGDRQVGAGVMPHFFRGEDAEGKLEADPCGSGHAVSGTPLNNGQTLPLGSTRHRSKAATFRVSNATR